MRIFVFFALVTTALLGGCSLVSTTTDSTAQLSEAFTNATAASSDASTGSDSDEAKFARAAKFIDSQLTYLRRDAAVGEGENLAALADLMGESDHVDFGHWMQTNYRDLFSTARSSEELVQYIAVQRG